MHTGRTNEKGLTLIEMAIVVLIAGLAISAAAAFAVPIIQTAKRVETEAKLQKLAEAINYYAVRNYRLPCPADPRLAPAGGEPFGTEIGSGGTGDNIPAACGATFGIIPFQTLGLNRDMIFDGYDNPITYSISPVFSQDTTQQAMLVHPSCRTMEWYTILSEDTVDMALDDRVRIFTHKAQRKARFCCPGETVGTATDLIITNDGVNPVLTNIRSADESGVAAWTDPNGPCPDTVEINLNPCPGADLDCCTGYDTTTRPFSTAPNATVHPNDRIAAVAYVLVSHGENGSNGSFDLVNGGRVGVPGNANEAENADDDQTFDDIFNKGDFYDDILLWWTQDLIFANQGESCAVP